MRAGLLRSRITIQQRTQSGVNSLNEPEYTWATWKEVNGAIVSRRGGEQFLDEGGKARFSEVIFRFRFRFFDVDGIDSAMRILFEGQIYDIRGILPGFDRRSECMVDATLQDGAV